MTEKLPDPQNLVIEKIIEQLDSILDSPLDGSDVDALRQTTLDVILFEKHLSVLKSGLFDCCDAIRAITENLGAIEATQEHIDDSLKKLEGLTDLSAHVQNAEKFYEKGDFLESAKCVHSVLFSGNAKFYEKIEPVSLQKMKNLYEELSEEIVRKCRKSLFKQNFEKCLNHSPPLRFLGMEEVDTAIRAHSKAKVLAKQLDAFESNNSPESIMEASRKTFDTALDCVHKTASKSQNDDTDCTAMTASRVMHEVFPRFEKMFEKYVVVSGADRYVKATENEGGRLDLIKLDQTLCEISFFFQEIFYFESSLNNIVPKLNSVPPTAFLKTAQPKWPQSLSAFSFDSFYAQPTLVPPSAHAVKAALAKYYTALETAYMRQGAFEVLYGASSEKESSAILQKEAAEDLFYLFKKVAFRALSNFNVEALSCVLNNLNTVLATDVKKNLEAAWSKILKNRTVADFFEPKSEEREQFFCALRCVCSVADYFAVLVESMRPKFGEVCKSFSEKEELKAKCAFEDLIETYNNYLNIDQKGLTYVSSIVFALLNPALERAKSTPFDRPDDDSGRHSDADSVSLAVVSAFSAFSDSAAPLFGQRVFAQIVADVCKLFARRLEALVAKKRFSIWGGVRLDKEVLWISNYFEKIGGPNVRSEFARLKAIGLLLQFDTKSDVENFKKYKNRTCSLSDSEIDQIVALRVDLGTEQN